MKFLTLTLVVVGLIGADARAHSFSDSLLTIDNNGTILRSEWQLSLQDLEVAVGVDGNQDGKLTWGELRDRRDDVEGYALGRLVYTSAEVPCQHYPQELLMETRRDVPYAVLRFDSVCDGGNAVEPLNVRYGAMFDIDPQHRGFITFAGSDAAPLIVRADAPMVELGRQGTTLAKTLTYISEGIWHIWSGTDHLLFLLTLLLGVVCVTHHQRVWKDTILIVTAFTVAHSITLVLGSFHVISVSSFWIEFVIAASIAVAAVTNLMPRLEAYRTLLAFGFGLIHGFGFAGVLEEMSITGEAFVTALVSFNVGVEVGQLAVVAGFLIFSRVWAYLGIDPNRLKQVGSMAIAATGIAWAALRAVG